MDQQLSLCFWTWVCMRSDNLFRVVKTAPVCALQMEAGEMPLWLHRKQLMAHYWINLVGHNESHPAKTVLGACWERGKVQKSSFGWVGKDIAEQMKVHRMEICPTVF